MTFLLFTVDFFSETKITIFNPNEKKKHWKNNYEKNSQKNLPEKILLKWLRKNCDFCVYPKG